MKRNDDENTLQGVFTARPHVLHYTPVNFVSNMALTPCSLVEINPADDNNYRPTAADCSTDPDSCPDVKMATSFHIPYDSSLANRHDLRRYKVVATCVNTVSQFAISQALKAVLPYSPSVRRPLYLHLQDEAGPKTLF